MEDHDEKLILLEDRTFLRRKISLTVPICALLITIFLLSALLVTVVAFYWTEDAVCFINNNEQTIKSKPVYYSRPKRSTTLKETKSLCLSSRCCSTDLGSNVPWTENRLPTTIYPLKYQLKLELYNLNQPTDHYNGTVDIVIKVRSATYDIVLHGYDLFYSNITVSERVDSDNVSLTVDCALTDTTAKTLTIHLIEELKVGSMYDVRISFYRDLNVHGTGLFENQFKKDQYGSDVSRIILTHFKSVHAREAFPCFDEPGYKAEFQLTVLHENNTQILSNWDEARRFWEDNRYETEFETVPPISTALIAFSIFYTDDFDHRTAIVTDPITNRTITINLWARKMFFTHENGMSVDAPLEMIQQILTALLHIFQDIQTPIVPNKIDILTAPEYPSDAVSHWGFIIFTERALLHNPYTTSEMEHQRIALIIAKELAEQWYGNFVTFQWWTDLWLQEAIVNYLKYYAIDIAYPEWNIHTQFAVTELLPTMYDDSMSTSHPIYKSVNSAAQIDELYDSIETIKATAIFRMADYYVEKTMGVKNQTLANIVFDWSFLHEREYGYLVSDELLDKYQIGLWTGPEFFDRWLYQSNFPIISARFLSNASENIFQLEQKRFLRSHIYGLDLYLPETNPFNYIWYIPITCRFSNHSDRFDFNRTFLLDRQLMNISFGSVYYNYFYCNTDFAGYYLLDYPEENWQELSDALDNDNTQLIEIDRANLINNAFFIAQTLNESYLIVRQMTQFLSRQIYTDLRPWQTLSYHVNRMLDVLEFESLYSVVHKYFQWVVRNYYQTYEATLWNNNGTFSELILKNLITQLACRLQLQECIDKVTSLWYEAYPVLYDGMTNHSIVAHAREIVYRIHFQNTYNDSQWLTIESDYHNFIDVQERYRLLEALTQSRQIWHLHQLLYQDAEENSDRDMDIIEVLTLLAKNPNGRELVWLYYRENWTRLQLDYGWTNQRLGQLMIDITSTFEDDFHESELLDFLTSTSGVEANLDARFWSLERTNINLWWIINKSTDMLTSFDLEP